MNEPIETPEVYSQTVFASQEPVMQNLDQLPQKPSQPMSAQKKLMIILGGVIVVCLILLLVIAATMQRKRKEAELSASPTPGTQQAGTLSTLGQALKDTETVITAADPTVNNLPFPPVNFEITLKQQK